LVNFSEDHVLNTTKALKKQQQMKNVCCFSFCEAKIYTGYEDGLICSWKADTGEILFPMIGHTNKINCITGTEGSPFIFSASNDCTVR
jgi:WD40 repeat protein